MAANTIRRCHLSAGLGHIVAAQAILEILGSTMAVTAFLSSRLCPWTGSRAIALTMFIVIFSNYPLVYLIRRRKYEYA